MVYGYIRVSTNQQDIQMQVTGLLKAGVLKENIFSDILSGRNLMRPNLQRLLSLIKAGDKVMVWKLDRLGRSIQDLIFILGFFKDKQVEFSSLHENIDTTTPAGKLTFHIFSAIAEFEREIIRLRVRHGLSAAKDRGVQLGRPSAISPQTVLQLNADFLAGVEISQLMLKYDISRAGVYRYRVRYLKEKNDGV